jgi:hypothetical protein
MASASTRHASLASGSEVRSPEDAGVGRPTPASSFGRKKSRGPALVQPAHASYLALLDPYVARQLGVVAPAGRRRGLLAQRVRKRAYWPRGPGVHWVGLIPLPSGDRLRRARPAYGEHLAEEHVQSFNLALRPLDGRRLATNAEEARRPPRSSALVRGGSDDHGHRDRGEQQVGGYKGWACRRRGGIGSPSKEVGWRRSGICPDGLHVSRMGRDAAVYGSG